MSERDRTEIQRSDLGKFPKEVADLVLHVVNTEGIKWREMDKNHLALYPPDGVSRPFKIASVRPGKDQVRFIERQFMAVHGVKDADGHVPGREEEVVTASMEDVVTPEVNDAHEAVRTLAAALGVSLGGTVSEEDYLAVVAEKDACQSEVESLREDVTSEQRQVDLRDETIADLTKQRDQLLGEHSDMERRVAAARAALDS